MKNLLVILGLFLAFGLVSCKKAEILEEKEPIEVVDETISVFGEWVLVGGKMYMEDLESGEKTVFDHFDATKSVSSLRYDGFMFEFERIVIDSTRWTFIEPVSGSTGTFLLDNDEVEPYGLQITNSNMSIIENESGVQQLGGSARPITAFIDEYDENMVNFYVQEAYTSIGDRNYKYFSELTFKKL